MSASAAAQPPSSPRAGLAELPLAELLERIAAATPTPGGGSASAVACSLAAGLVEMAAGFAPDEGSTRARAAELRAHALALADRELRSYVPVLEALRLPADDPRRPARLTEARSSASEAPLQIAAVAAELAGLAAEIAHDGSPHLAGDAAAAALIAESACRAAAQLVRLNLADHGEDPRSDQADALAARAAAARTYALASGARTASR